VLTIACKETRDKGNCFIEAFDEPAPFARGKRGSSNRRVPGDRYVLIKVKWLRADRGRIEPRERDRLDLEQLEAILRVPQDPLSQIMRRDVAELDRLVVGRVPHQHVPVLCFVARKRRA
jgi:hypothetical protein